MAARRLPCPRPALWLALAILCLGSPLGHGQTVRNTASGDLAGLPLETSRATVSLLREGDAVTSLTGEITPDTLPAGATGAALDLHLLPQIGAGNTGFDTLTVTLPSLLTGATVVDLSVDGTALSADCAGPAPGRYCATVANGQLDIRLGSVVDTDAAQVRVGLAVDAAAVPGSGAFTAAVLNSGVSNAAPQAALAGDADGVPDNGNTLTLQLRAVVPDAGASLVSVTPPVNIADGVASSEIVVSLVDTTGAPMPGRQITIATSRPGSDTLTATLLTTDAEGNATSLISSVEPGTSVISVTDESGVVLETTPEVLFTHGVILEIDKDSGRKTVAVGESVPYRVIIRNTDSDEVTNVRLRDVPAPVFKLLADSARLDGQPVASNGGAPPYVFEIGTVPGLVDSNGNGIADPGEPGYMELTYTLVAGAGVRPGDYDNRAVAFDLCDTCVLSNEARARVEVVHDRDLELGTLIGRVFHDRDADGILDPGEPGVAGAMVALDNGTYVLTDPHGRFHIPAVEPGQRLLKLNLQRVSGNAKVTTRNPLVLTVTPGLLAKANFGVDYTVVEEQIGRPPTFGVDVDATAEREPLTIVGTTVNPAMLVNGRPLALPAPDVQLGEAPLDEILHFDGGQLRAPARFSLRSGTDAPVDRWRLEVVTAIGQPVWSTEGEGPPPELIEWDGRGQRPLAGGGIYEYRLYLDYADGTRGASPPRLLGVNRSSVISLQLSGGAFVSGSHELTGTAKALLDEAAITLRESPDERVVIAGHTDAVGRASDNRTLAGRRARAARDYLVEVSGLPAGQFILESHGESRPLASNDTPAGRELNRRVEIHGELTSTERAEIIDRRRPQPRVVVAGQSVDLDPDGRFAAAVNDDGSESLAARIETRDGRAVDTSVRLPKLDLRSPTGRFKVEQDLEDGRYRRSEGVPGGRHELLLDGATDPGNEILLDGKPLEVGPDGRFRTWVPVRPGRNVLGIAARNAEGFLRISNLRVNLDTGGSNGPLVVVEPVPRLTLRLPPEGLPLNSPHLVVPGATDPGNRVTINGAEVETNAAGEFVATLELPPGTSTLRAEVTDRNGHRGVIERSLEYRDTEFFFLAFADGTIGHQTVSGNLAASGESGDDEVITQGRMTYYLKGRIKGKYLVTSAFDSGQDDVDQLFDNLSDTDNERLLTNLDPDRLYPVYGDDSTLVYDAQSQGRFFLAVESDELDLLVGNYPLAFDATELARYQRTLYGAQANYRSSRTTRYGQPVTELQAFVAEVKQSSARDELRATGGSLYHLSHGNVVEGSEQVTLVVRDQHTGLTLSRVPQQRDVDYTIKYADGRILFRRPISQVENASTLISAELLAGNPVYVQVDYETRTDNLEQRATGARARRQFGDHLALGGTIIDDEQISSDYHLRSVDAEVRLGHDSRVVAEYAQSEGDDSLYQASDDGGLTYQSRSADADDEGEAFKLAADVDLGDFWGPRNQTRLKAYFKRLDTGYSSNGNAADAGTERFGAQVSVAVSGDQLISLRHDTEERLATGDRLHQTFLRWDREWRGVGFSAEVQDRRSDGVGDSLDGTMAAARAEYTFSDRLTTRLEHQQTLSGEDNDQTALGATYGLSDKLGIEARAMTGSRGNSAEVGASFDVAGKRVYVTQRQQDDRDLGTSSMTVLGSESAIGEGGTAYTEYQWGRTGQGDLRKSLHGLRQDWAVTEGFTLLFSGEQSELDQDGVGGEQYALALGFAYDDGGALKASMRNEYRKETGAREYDQWLSTTRAEYRLQEALTLLGKYRRSYTDDTLDPEHAGTFTEGSIGLAYRPITHDRFNALARYTRLTGDPTSAQLSNDLFLAPYESDVISTDWSFDVLPSLEWVGKGAFKRRRETGDGSRGRTDTTLAIQRLNLALPANLAVGSEYRWLTVDETNDEREGWLTEVMWDGMDHVRFGVGYNFTDFSDDIYSENDYSVKGWFLRLQGTY